MTGKSEKLDFAVGDFSGLQIPLHAEALRKSGCAFLTEAFRSWGVLDAGNAVKRVVAIEHCPGGSTGSKLFLTVEYETAAQGLHERLFVKFSRDFEDPARDERGKFEMDGEIAMARLSHDPQFPIAVPRICFADNEVASHSGLLIAERIAFGEGPYEHYHPKCMDYLINDPLEHYRAIVRALARLAGAHRAGRLPSIATKLFPYDQAAAATSVPIGYTPSELRERFRSFELFVKAAPQLFPADINSADFFREMGSQVEHFVDNEARINGFLQGDAGLIALCHWNANIDNAFFWRDSDGVLDCGLLDWGRAGQMNVAFALWGALSAAHHDILEHHLNELLDLFIDTFATEGGGPLRRADLRLHLDLYASIMGLAYFLDSPARIQQHLPEVLTITGPHDPVLQRCEKARNQLHISTVVLNLWRRNSLSGMLSQMTEMTERA